MDVIINSGSGAGADESLRLRLVELFLANGAQANISLANSGAEVVELARRAAQSASQVVVAGGGDGTINAVASALIGTGKTLGILPVGTLNHFAKDLHIPLDLEGAV